MVYPSEVVLVAVGLLVDLSSFWPTSQESVQSVSSDQLLDLVLELDVFLSIMTVVMMVQTVLAWVVLAWMRPHFV